MPLRCPKCGCESVVAQWPLSDDRGGATAQCSKCGGAFAVSRRAKRASAAPVEVDLAALADAPTGPEVVLRSQGPTRNRTVETLKRNWRPILGATACLALFIAARSVATAVRQWIETRETVAELVPAEPENSNWLPDPVLFGQLGEYKTIDHFRLKLPKDYVLFGVMKDPSWRPRNGHFVGLEFRGPSDDKAVLIAMIVRFSRDEPLKGGLEEALDRFFGWLKYNALATNLSYSSGEIGRLNGRDCIRSDFVGNFRTSHKKKAVSRGGMVYTMLDGNRQVCIYRLVAADAEPKDISNLLDASLLTWRDISETDR